MRLPERFLDHMKQLLGAEYDDWLASCEKPARQGLRINTLKTDVSRWESITPYGSRRIPWTSNGYYCDEADRPSRDSYYYAGLYYLQEPSAMAPAAVLPVAPGDLVLDLCAAPGGKSTELGARLCGQGMLVSNDISNSRARALLKNLELFGIANICVCSEAPQKLVDTFGAFFDKILVDAPCSGEGMFRKDPDLIKSWEQHGPDYYAPIQREILSQAARMLKPGGYLLYSTCTFSEEEDEAAVDWLLEQEPDMEYAPITLFDGAKRGTGGQPVLRLFSHRLEGEGHFLALLHKKDSIEEEAFACETPSADESCGRRKNAKTAAPVRKKVDPEVRRLEKESDFPVWEAMVKLPFDHTRLMIRDNLVYYLPEAFNPGWNLRYLRTGLLLGEWKGKRFEPSQAAAMALSGDTFSQSFSLSHDDERVIRYLKGETLLLEEDEQLPKGWILVCVDGYPLGWAKSAANSLKNKYYPGWRWQ